MSQIWRPCLCDRDPSMFARSKLIERHGANGSNEMRVRGFHVRCARGKPHVPRRMLAMSSGNKMIKKTHVGRGRRATAVVGLITLTLALLSTAAHLVWIRGG